MPKVTGPLFSITARGTLGDVISYRSRPGYQQVEKKPVHRDAKSAGQLAQRASFLGGCSYWNALSPGEKANYNVLGDKERMTGFNYVLRGYLRGVLP